MREAPRRPGRWRDRWERLLEFCEPGGARPDRRRAPFAPFELPAQESDGADTSWLPTDADDPEPWSSGSRHMPEEPAEPTPPPSGAGFLADVGPPTRYASPLRWRAGKRGEDERGSNASGHDPFPFPGNITEEPAPELAMPAVPVPPWAQLSASLDGPDDAATRQRDHCLEAGGAEEPVVADVGPESRFRPYAHRRARGPSGGRVTVVSAVAVVALIASLAAALGDESPTPAVVSLAASHQTMGMANLTGAAGAPAAATAASLHFTRATSAPAPAPAAVATAPPLAPHEVFGFAPYWTLDQATGFDVSGFTTIAYFGVGVNANGSLAESGPGWAGYESQQLADLVTRAHAAGDRVVLTVNSFAQSDLDALTSNPTAASTLASELVGVIEARNLDGVNIDFEGTGSADRQGLTRLVGTVATTLHSVDPHWQVTVDTYASSAGDPAGFYDVRSLGEVADGLFVMAYQLNLAASPGSGSPLTDTTYPLETTAQQYSAAVTPSKVILGVGYFGSQWPTTTGTLSAEAVGAPEIITAGAEMTSGHPVYWDPVTDTAWTSFEVGTQWYEAFFQDPTSLYEDARMAQSYGLGGVGAWALGFDDDDPAMTAALDGNSPVIKDYSAGPTSTSHSAAAAPNPTQQPASPAPPRTTTRVNLRTATFSGAFAGVGVDLTPISARAPGSGDHLLGTLTGFTTDDPTLSCLSTAGPLPVWQLGSDRTHLFVVASEPDDCVTRTFRFAATGFALVSGTSGSSASPETTTTTSPPETTTTTSPPETTTTTSSPETTTTSSPETTTTGVPNQTAGTP